MSLPCPPGLALVVAALCLTGCARSTPPVTPVPEPAALPSTSIAAAPTPDVAAALVAYQWQLKEATDAAGQSLAAFFPSPDTPLGLLAGDGRISVTGGCNRMSAGYELRDGTQMQLSPAQSTMMACPPPLAEADAALARFLTGTLQVAIEKREGAPRLQLTAADGTTLIFGGTSTPETRFGGPGTRAFLEVSPEPCAAPLASRCLKVRERHFDENGLASGTPGEWRDLPGGIEGYTPVKGEQHVVRVKRFEQAGAANGPSSEHFVLDLIVETRTAR